MEKSIKRTWQIALFNGVIKMLIQGVGFFWAIFFSSIGFSGTQIGIVIALTVITGLISIVPSGIINDRIKSKNLITLALLILAIQFIGISQTQTFPAVIFFSILGGIGGNLYVASADSIFYKSIKGNSVTKKIAIYQSVNYLTIGAGLIASGQILNLNIPFQTLILSVGIGFLLMTLVSRTLPKTITTNFKLLHYKSDIFRPKVLFFLSIVLLFAIHFGAENTSYGLFLEKTLGLPKLWTGLYMGTAIFLMGFWAIFFSKILKKIRVKSLLFTGLLMSSLGHVLMAVKEPGYSFIFRMFHEAGDAAMYVFFAYGIASMFDIKRIGGNSSIFTLTTIIGATIGSLLFGPIGEKFGYDVPFIATGAVIFIAFIIALIFNNLILKYKE